MAGRCQPPLLSRNAGALLKPFAATPLRDIICDRKKPVISGPKNEWLEPSLRSAHFSLP